MSDCPIIFSAPMVRAILDGRKTQTRRVIKPQPGEFWCPEVGFYCPTIIDKYGDEDAGEEIYGASDADDGRKSPYGHPGDRLWVRETWSIANDLDTDIDMPKMVSYRATDTTGGFATGRLNRWRPSIHMPRRASRITLEITNIRVERLQDISRGDAIAEGCPYPTIADGTDPRAWFSILWLALNGSDSWHKNPWVWVVEFRRI